MPQPLDPQTPSDQTPRPGQPDPESSAAARLLEEIRERMERLEGHLSLRERRLVRLERNLREADARLQAERGRLSEDRSAVEQELSERLREQEHRLQETSRILHELNRSLQEQQQKTVEASGRERGLLDRVEALTRQRDQASNALGDTGRQLQEYQRRQAELEAQLEDLRRRYEAALDRQHHTETLSPGAASLDRLTRQGWSLRENWWRRLPAQARWSAGIAAVVLPLMSLILALTAYHRDEPVYRVRGMVSAGPRGAALLKDVLSRTPVPEGIAQFLDEPSGTLLLSQTTQDPDAGVLAVDHAAATILDNRPPVTTAPARLERQTRRQALLAQMEELDRQLAPTGTHPAGLTDDVGASVAAYRQAVEERSTVAAGIVEMTRRLALAPPKEDAIRLDPQRIKTAIAADRKLQADSDMLAQREVQLSAVLRKALEEGQPHFEKLAAAVREGDVHLDELAKSPLASDVGDSLQALRQALNVWSDSAASLALVWTAERQALDRVGGAGGPLDRYSALAPAAKQFLDDSGEAKTVFEETLTAISQGGDEPTKRLVLHKSLTGKLHPAVAARDAVAQAAAQLLPSTNLQLGALLQNVGGLGAQVREGRSRLESELHRRAVSEAREAYDQDMTQARRERDRLVHRASELDQRILRNASEALSLITRSEQARSQIIEQMALVQQRGRILAEILEIDDTDFRELTAAPPQVEFHAIPAQAETLQRNRLGAALLSAAAPPALAVVLTLILVGWRWWQASRRSADHYAELLRKSTREYAQTSGNLAAAHAGNGATSKAVPASGSPSGTELPGS